MQRTALFLALLMFALIAAVTIDVPPEIRTKKSCDTFKNITYCSTLTYTVKDGKIRLNTQEVNWKVKNHAK